MEGQNEIRNLMSESLNDSQRRNPAFSLRAFGKKLDLSASEISEILRGKRRVGKRKAESILEKLKISDLKKNEILENIKSDKNLLKKLSTYTKDYFKQVDMDVFNSISDWHYFAILALSQTKDFQSCPKWISERINITEVMASEALDSLVRLEMLSYDSENKLIYSGVGLSTLTDVPNSAIKNNHLGHLELAKESLYKDDVTERSITGITIPIDPAKLDEAKKIIQQFERSLCEFLQTDGELKEVYRFSTQLFPLSKKLLH